MAESPVLVVGAGPTGLMLAVELARRGIAFRLIDRHPQPLLWDRATVIKPRTMEIFDSLGLAEDFVNRGAVVHSVVLFADGEPAPPITFDHVDSPYPFMLSLPEHETEGFLTGKLRQLGGEVERGVELVGLEEGDRDVRVRLRSLADGREWTDEACWVVGTDGVHSAVRALAHDDFVGHDNPSLWAVVDAHLHGWEHPGNAIAAQMESPAVNPIPLRDGRWRIYIRPDDESDDLLDKVDAGLSVMSPGAAMRDPDEPRYFHTQSRVAEQYRIGRVLLAGDAAHACSPIQGHGMNTGMQDAHNLGWKLALVVRGDAPEALLDTYGMERRPIAAAVVQSGDEAESRARVALHDRKLRTSLVAKLQSPDMRRVAALDEVEIAHHYGSNLIVGEPSPSPADGAASVGFRVGDVGGLKTAAGPSRLYEITRPPVYHLFVLVGDADGAALEHARDIAGTAAERYRPHVKAHVVTRSLPDGEIPDGVVLDSAGSLHRRLAGNGPTFFLLRPDGHLGYRGAPSLEGLDVHLGRVIRPRLTAGRRLGNA